MLQIPAEAIRDTVTAVFRQRAYDRSLRETVWNRLLAWLSRMVERARDAASDSPVVYWTSIAILGTLVALVIARVAYVAYARRSGAARAGRAGAGAAGRARDPLALARELSAAGRFTEAAHALYAALLDRLARQERLRLHPSRTAGDYARALRARGSGAYGPFRAFVRVYDVVVYGLGYCDAERYARLEALAAPLLSPAASGAASAASAARGARRVG